MPKISVIVPVYNSEEYLRTCLDSLVNQTLKDIEIIAIDDNSTDNSLSILYEYATKYPNVKVYHNEVNIGQGATRNKGIEICSGKYIGFTDSDDYVHPRMFEDMYKEAEINHNPPIVTTGLIFVKDNYYANKDLSFMSRTKGIEVDFIRNPNALLDESPAVWNKIFRCDIIKSYQFLENCLWEDVAFSFSKLIEASRIIRLNNQDYFYRRQIEKGISGRGYKVNPNHYDIFKVADEIERHTKQCGKYELFKPQIKFIQFSTCFDRIDEISSWDISKEEKKAYRYKMYETIYNKYGSLDNIDKEELSYRISPIIIEEYISYCESITYDKKNKL